MGKAKKLKEAREAAQELGTFSYSRPDEVVDVMIVVSV